MSDSEEITAMPTKAFFVDMLVRDIKVERAVLDLLDNCIDGARRLRPGDDADYMGLSVRIALDGERFLIEDNCGGFEVSTAQAYAFRFGRPSGAESTPHSIGQFGVGMKRALFKFGRYFEVQSTTSDQRWSMHVDVEEWLKNEDDWVFAFDEIQRDGEFTDKERGTRIEVSALRREVAARFASKYVERQLAEMIRSHQRRFLAQGLAVEFNGRTLTASELSVRSGNEFQPAIEELLFDGKSDAPVKVRLVVGVSDPDPSIAGWYVVCNRRVIVSADRTEAMGWGTTAVKDGLPKYHNDYARFRGVVFFDCEDAGKLPWNTTKTGLDDAAIVWQETYERMREHARSVLEFLSALAHNVAEYGRESSPLLAALDNETTLKDVEEFPDSRQRFTWNRNPPKLGPKMVRVQYSREEEKIEEMKDALHVTSAKAVGELSFDWMYKAEVGEAE